MGVRIELGMEEYFSEKVDWVESGHQHRVLLGGPGVGKTEEMKKIAFAILAARQEGNPLGMTVIDPCGSLFEAVRDFCMAHEISFYSLDTKNPEASDRLPLLGEEFHSLRHQHSGNPLAWFTHKEEGDIFDLTEDLVTCDPSLQFLCHDVGGEVIDLQQHFMENGVLLIRVTNSSILHEAAVNRYLKLLLQDAALKDKVPGRHYLMYDVSDPSFSDPLAIKFIKESRKYGVASVTAMHSLSKISDVIRDVLIENINSWAIFGKTDRESLKMLFEDQQLVDDLLDLPKFQFVLRGLTQTWLTPQGMDHLKNELSWIQEKALPDLRKQIKEAESGTDEKELSEKRKKVEFYEQRIIMLQDMIDNAEVIGSDREIHLSGETFAAFDAFYEAFKKRVDDEANRLIQEDGVKKMDALYTALVLHFAADVYQAHAVNKQVLKRVEVLENALHDLGFQL